MEDGLRAVHERQRKVFPSVVLILVLMEDGLRERNEDMVNFNSYMS